MNVIQVVFFNKFLIFVAIELAQPYIDPVYSNGGLLLEDDEDLGLRAQALYDYQAGEALFS